MPQPRIAAPPRDRAEQESMIASQSLRAAAAVRTPIGERDIVGGDYAASAKGSGACHAGNAVVHRLPPEGLSALDGPRPRCAVGGVPEDRRPLNLDAFVRQQYRWCSGNVGIVFSWRLWAIPMPIPARLTYISGFLYYAYTALLTFFGPLIPIVYLAFLPGHIRPRNFLALLPAMFTGFVLYPLWHRSRYGLGIWPLGIARGWAHVFAIWDGAWGKSMSWHPTRTPGSSLRRFRIGVRWWSGSVAVLWVALAIWRTVTVSSMQFVILLLFGLLNAAVVSRVIFPGGKTA